MGTVPLSNAGDTKATPFLVPAARIASDEPSEALMAKVAGLQHGWAARPLRERIAVLRGARHRLAELTAELADSISPELSRTPADTIAAEVLPLLAAARFLEKNAAQTLEPVRWGAVGRPFWLPGLRSEVQRVPFGTVLVVGPANYPLFLPGVQTMQALVAGNAVIWKPGRGGSDVARLFVRAFEQSGLPTGLLQVTEETIEAAQRAIAHGVDKVFFTGSATAGRTILKSLADSLTPSVVELSGCDAVVVLPGADESRVARALAFGMRLNGSATCMAPRRVLLVDVDGAAKQKFLDRLQRELSRVPGVSLPDPVRRQLVDLLQGAVAAGAFVVGDSGAGSLRPVLVLGVKPEMEIASADLFAPVLMVLESRSSEVEAVLDASPMALTVSIFGPERQARAMADRVTAGTVLINDLIVPTADPRLPFGGRRGSGFGVTRGREGLLEMTAVKVVTVSRNRKTRHYEPTGETHAEMFRGLASAAHGETWTGRWRGLLQLAAAAKMLRKR